MVKALPLLGGAPFFHVNSDTIWIDGVKPNLDRLAEAFDPATMDALLLLAPVADQHRLCRPRRFHHGADGRLTRRGEREVAPFVYAGAAMLRPELFKERRPGAFSLTALFDRAAAAGRLHGLRLEGVWMHVGTPDAIARGRGRDRGERGVKRRRWPYQQQRLSVATRLIPHRPPARAMTQCERHDSQPRVFTIPASAPFLPTLIAR